METRRLKREVMAACERYDVKRCRKLVFVRLRVYVEDGRRRRVGEEVEKRWEGKRRSVLGGGE